jgi:hypothetical protein
MQKMELMLYRLVLGQGNLCGVDLLGGLIRVRFEGRRLVILAPGFVDIVRVPKPPKDGSDASPTA